MMIFHSYVSLPEGNNWNVLLECGTGINSFLPVAVHSMVVNAIENQYRYLSYFIIYKLLFV